MVKQVQIGPPIPKLCQVYPFFVVILGITWVWVDRFGLALPFFHTTLQAQHYLFSQVCRQRAFSLIFQYVNTQNYQNGQSWLHQKTDTPKNTAGSHWSFLSFWPLKNFYTFFVFWPKCKNMKNGHKSAVCWHFSKKWKQKIIIG